MKLYQKIIILFVVISSIGLLELRGLGIIVRLLDVVSIGAILFLCLAYLLFGHTERKSTKSFALPVILILSGVLLSALPAHYLHGQPILITIYQQRHIYAILFYFLLFYLNPDPDWLSDVIFYTAVAIGSFYVLQYVMFPFIITDAKIFLNRGTVRMNLPGTYFMYAGFFLSIDRFFTTYKRKYGFGALLLFAVAILSGFRSTLALYIAITAGFLLLSKRVNNKILLFITASIFAISGFFVFNDIVTEMVESGKEESKEGKENIRYRAATYFLSLNKADETTYFLGNGEPSQRSRYGMKLFYIAIIKGYYLTDIGIFGYYFKFGILASIGVLLILIKVILSKIDKRSAFIKMFFIYQLAVIANTQLAFDNLPDIIVMSMFLYMADISKSISKQKDELPLLETA